MLPSRRRPIINVPDRRQLRRQILRHKHQHRPMTILQLNRHMRRPLIFKRHRPRLSTINKHSPTLQLSLTPQYIRPLQPSRTRSINLPTILARRHNNRPRPAPQLSVNNGPGSQYQRRIRLIMSSRPPIANIRRLRIHRRTLATNHRRLMHHSHSQPSLLTNTKVLTSLVLNRHNTTRRLYPPLPNKRHINCRSRHHHLHTHRHDHTRSNLTQPTQRRSSSQTAIPRPLRNLLLMITRVPTLNILKNTNRDSNIILTISVPNGIFHQPTRFSRRLLRIAPLTQIRHRNIIVRSHASRQLSLNTTRRFFRRHTIIKHRRRSIHQILIRNRTTMPQRHLDSISRRHIQRKMTQMARRSISRLLNIVPNNTNVPRHRQDRPMNVRILKQTLRLNRKYCNSTTILYLRIISLRRRNTVTLSSRQTIIRTSTSHSSTEDHYAVTTAGTTHSTEPAQLARS